MDKLKRSALFPFLFALFPLLALWASNVEYIAPWMTLRVILITLAATCIGFFSLRYMYKSSIKAGIFVCVLLLIFFSYGHLYRMFGERVLFGFLPIRHRTLVALSIVLIGLTIWLLKRMRSNHDGIILPLNLIFGLALVYPLITIIGYQIATARPGSQK